MSQYHVYGLGNALLDIEYDVTDAQLRALDIQKGVMTLVDAHQQGKTIEALGAMRNTAPGGSAANTLVAINQFGGKAFYSFVTANDDAGSTYRAALTECGVDHNFLHHAVPEGVTGKCLVMVSDDAERTMNTYLGISETLSPEQLHLDALRNSQYLYIEGYLVSSPTAMAAVMEAKKVAQENGVKVAFTLSDPFMVELFKANFDTLIGEGVDLMFCNEDEAKKYTGEDGLDAVIAKLKSIAKTFALTRGEKGSIVFDGENTFEVAAPQIKAIDSVGAGDAYAGAFLYGITHGLGFKRAAELASQSGSAIVAQYGPRLSQDQVDKIKAS